jgi:hypothetical protein
MVGSGPGVQSAWTVPHLARALPEPAPPMDPLLATLVGAGLVTSIEWPRPGSPQRTYKLARVQRLVAGRAPGGR